MNRLETFIVSAFTAFVVCLIINMTKTKIEKKRFKKQKQIGQKANFEFQERLLHQIFAIDCTAISLTVFVSWILTYDIKNDYFQVVEADPVLNWISTFISNYINVKLGYSMLTIMLIVMLLCSFWILFRIVPKIDRSVMIFNIEVYKPVIRGYNLLSTAPLAFFIYIQTLL